MQAPLNVFNQYTKPSCIISQVIQSQTQECDCVPPSNDSFHATDTSTPQTPEHYYHASVDSTCVYLEGCIHHVWQLICLGQSAIV